MLAFLIQLLALKRSQDRGFTLVLALSMGLVMMAIATTLIFRVSRHEAIASARTEAGDSLAVAEAGVARTLAQMTKPENAALLNRNYDLVAGTSNAYLGADSVPHNNDQIGTGVDEWTTYSPAAVSCSTTTTSPNINYNGTVGTDGQYILRAYRYNSTAQTGTFLVEGKRKNSVSYLAVTVSIDATSAAFPGVLAKNKIQLADREVLGTNGNIYYNSTASPTPGLTNVAGRTINCQLNPTLSDTVPTSGIINLGDIKDSDTDPPTTLLIDPTTDGFASGAIAYYKADNLQINKKTIEIDTTNNPVYLYITDNLLVHNDALIINKRTDGNAPKIGDLRIIVASNKNVGLDGRGCIKRAFIYAPNSEFNINTISKSCASLPSNPVNANIEGVVWARDILNNNLSSYGIIVPDVISNFTDINSSVNLPSYYSLGKIKNWQRYQP